MIVKAIVWIMSVAAGSIASGAEVWHQSIVRSVYPQANGSVVVVLDQNSSCSNQNNPQYSYIAAGQNSVTADAVKAMLAAVCSHLLPASRSLSRSIHRQTFAT
jgi:hypothetical protein